MTQRRPRGAQVRFALILMLLGALGGNAPSASAAVSIRVSPALVEFTAKPDGTGSQTLTISNDGDEAVSLAVAVEPYRGATDQHSAVDWLTVEPASVQLQAGEQAAITVDIAVPPALESGGRYALITFTTESRPVAGSGAGMAGKLGAAFLFNVEGEGPLSRHVEVERFAPVLEPDGRIGFRAMLRNDGNLHVFPRGLIEVRAADGTPYGQLEFPQTTPFLPASDMVVTAQGSLPLPPDGVYHAEASVMYGGDEAATATVEFKPSALLAVERADVCENLDRGPTLAIGLRNDGALGLQPYVQMTIRDADGNLLGVPPVAPSPLIWPGETTEIVVDAPERLTSGEYVLAISAGYAAPDPDGRTALPPIDHETPFQIGGLGGSAIPLCPLAA